MVTFHLFNFVYITAMHVQVVFYFWSYLKGKHCQVLIELQFRKIQLSLNEYLKQMMPAKHVSHKKFQK